MDEEFQNQEKKMKCLHCEAEVKMGTVPFHIDRNGVHVRLDEIPAWLCPQCGESFFEEEEIDSMQALVTVVEEQSHKFSRVA